jgi:hypothetical protein
MSNQSDLQTRILSRVRALVERGERVPAADLALLWTVSDTNALAGIARIPRERRYGRSAFHTDVIRVEYRGEPADELAERIGETGSVIVLAPTGRIEPQALPNAARGLARIGSVMIATTAERVDAAARAIGCSHRDVLTQLRTGAPLVVTGEGAELFDEELRARLAPRAVAADTWIAVHRAAHAQGIPTIATMTYLTHEQPEAYARHLETIRSLQEETGGFAAFVPVPVHNRHEEATYLATPTAQQSLRAIAIARIALDNIEHIGVAPALVGAEVAYVAMSYGADTIDTTILPGSVRLFESEASGFDLPVLGEDSAAAPPRELVASRLVEAHFVPTAVDPVMKPRMDAITREAQ